MINDSILSDIKSMLNISEEDLSFDKDILSLINTDSLILNQLGYGPDEPLVINKETTWESFGEPEWSTELAKTHIYQKVRLNFDPPNNSTLLENIKDLIAEYEYRILLYTEAKGEVNE
jgi:hypothetical protein